MLPTHADSAADTAGRPWRRRPAACFASSGDCEARVRKPGAGLADALLRALTCDMQHTGSVDQTIDLGELLAPRRDRALVREIEALPAEFRVRPRRR